MIPDAIHWPDALESLEAEHTTALAEDDQRAAKAKLNVNPALVLFSDSRNEVCREIKAAEQRVAEIERAMDAAEAAGDIDAYSEGEDSFSENYELLLGLEWRLRELEGRDARAEERGLRSEYWQSVL